MTTIKLKNGSGAPLAGDLVQGEPALDLTNKRLYTEDSGGTVIEVGTNPTSLTTGTVTVSDGVFTDGSAGSASVFNEDGTTADFRVESSGNTHMLFVDGGLNRVGIGTSSASYPLTVSGKISYSGAIGEGADNTLSSSSTTLILGESSTWQNLSLRTAGAERLRIDSSGRVGIGTSSPNTTFNLEVSGAIPAIFTATSAVASSMYGGVVAHRNTNTVGNGTGIGFQLEDAGNNDTEYAYIGGIIEANTSGSEKGGMIFATTFNNTRSERMRMDSSGNVGIGTSSPAKQLHISKGSNDTPTTVRIENVDTSIETNQEVNTIEFYSNDASASGTGVSAKIAQVAENPGNQYGLAFSVYNTTLAEAMRIDSSGNVLVGTTDTTLFNNTTGGGFSVSSNGFTQIAKQGADSADPVLILNQTGLDGEIQRFYKDGTAVGSIGTDTSRFKVKSSSLALYLENESNKQLVWGNVSSVPYFYPQSDNDTNLGYPTQRFKDLYLSGQWVSNGSNNTLRASFQVSGTQYGYINVATTGTLYSTSSDYRIKENVVALTNATERLKQLNPLRFSFIPDQENTIVDGFFAHEVADVVPEAITGTKDGMRDEEYEVTPAVYEDVVIPAVLDEEGNEVEAERTEQQLVTEAVMGTRSVPDYQGIDQSKLVPLLVATIQELEARITALESN